MGEFYEGCAQQLIDRVRHLGWLNAVPDPPPKAKRDPRSRGERFRAEEESGATRPELISPEIEPGLSYMLGYLFAVGPSCGGEVLSFQEIRAWSDQTGHVLDAWEAETLQRLSRAYLVEYHAASAADRPMPGAEKVQKAKPTRSEISQRISDAFARLEERDRKAGLSASAPVT